MGRTPEAASTGKSEVSFSPSKGESEAVVSFPPAQGESEPAVVSFPPPASPVVSFPPPAQGENEPHVVSFPPPSSSPSVASFPPPQVEAHHDPHVVSFSPNMAAAGQHAPPQFVGNPWMTGLFDCDEDPTNAFMTFMLPCVTFGQIAEVLDAGELTCPSGSFIYLLMMPVLCSQWVMGSKYRTKLRTRYGLVEAPYQDVVSHVFCPCCSLSQEFRELKKRGLDPALGWNGIIAQQQAMQYGNEQMKTPPPLQTMSSNVI